MKRKLFDKNLYLEALRQLRTPGIFFLVVNALAAILITMGMWVTNLESVRAMPERLPFTWNPMSMQPLLFSGFFLMAPVLTLRIFSFTRERKGSDFYHALPESRLCVFFSFFAAVMTYLTVIIIGTGALAGASTYFYPGWFQFSWADLMTYAFCMLVAAFYVAAAVACGTFLTGTAFTNIAVALLILFAPRLILMVFTMNVGSVCPVLNEEYLPFVLSYRYNLVFGMAAGIIRSWSLDSVYYWPAIWYTLVLGILYTAGAALLFHFRKSEAAGVAAPNRVLGAVYRLTVTFVFCLIPITLIFQAVTGGETLSSSEYFILAVLYIVAVIIFLAYELIASRKVSALVKALPSLVLVPVLNVAAIVILLGVVSMVNGYRPDASGITAVRILEGVGDSDDYFQQRISEADLKDDHSRKAAADGLRRMLDMEPGSIYKQGYRIYTVAIRSGAGWKYRNIALSEDEEQKLAVSLNSSALVKDVYMDLPKSGMGSGVTVTTWNVSQLTTGERLEIYETMRLEVQKMGFENWYSFLNGGSGSYADTLTVYVTRAGKTGTFNVPVSPEMPETFEKYCALQAAAADPDRILAFLEKADRADEYASADMYVEIWDLTGGACERVQLQYGTYKDQDHWYSPIYGKDAGPMEALLWELSEMESSGSPAIGNRLLSVCFNGYAGNSSPFEDGNYYIYLSETQWYILDGDLPEALSGFTDSDCDYKYYQYYRD